MPETARNVTLALLADRSEDASICPSEVARVISTDDDWRTSMPIVHTAVDTLLEQGIVQLSWKGHRLEQRTGPYRINDLRRR
ncbi:MAG TPA: DUF3253 domain-containing protein [Sphingopyxis sp.]|uniref:DUF3253 domain-containing protein n=1 Tax=Sphingopyxis sp. TaxID=1908224 RepID=UPI002CB33566|nr:DUF3253 domain-containing protein [Sphingopyxis sp.]HWW55535.1 DUF3253 domain-containing protein [Sphingopyxis sp.]